MQVCSVHGNCVLESWGALRAGVGISERMRARVGTPGVAGGRLGAWRVWVQPCMQGRCGFESWWARVGLGERTGLGRPVGPDARVERTCELAHAAGGPGDQWGHRAVCARGDSKRA